MAINLTGIAPPLQVFDMPRSVVFYREVLGFALVATSEPGLHHDWAMLQPDHEILSSACAAEVRIAQRDRYTLRDRALRTSWMRPPHPNPLPALHEKKSSRTLPLISSLASRLSPTSAARTPASASFVTSARV